MRRCRGKNKNDIRCKKVTYQKNGYCSVHQKQVHRSDNSTETMAVGAAAGAVAGGVPGSIIGAVAGFIYGKATRKEIMTSTKVFISFDYDNDADLKTMLTGQAKLADSPFEIADWSVKEHLEGDWKEKVRSKLRRVDQVVVICGEKTHTATGVSDEVKIAQEESVPYFLLKARANKNCTKPNAAKSSDKLYQWTWDNLKSLVGGER